MRKIIRSIFLAAAGLLPAASSAADTNAGLPKCPPDWKVELVAAAPAVRYPSVVCGAPDGRIFVGEDYKDGIAMGGEEPIDRILCFHPDGRVTVFAEKLHAVFGLLYLDGKLYVHHTPKFSVFDDQDGIGTNRVDLVDCTNPKPWIPSLNDHIPSGFRLAMDGYFYLCTGDKGIYGFVGRDGRKAELRGGGILRLRPDATGAEVFCHGTRNFLDTALTAADDIFTLDNSDDGQGWWTRLSHMVDGGYYGYPYDYKANPPHMLGTMADYGGGGPAGAAAYNEDALPAEFHDSLFFAEWSKRQINRVRVARDGASFKVLTNEVFISAGEQEFRPVGINFMPDGLSLVVADWNHHHWKEGKEAGRLLKFTYTGPSRAVARPDWFAAAAVGRADGVSTAKLVHGLRHPAQAVRLVAQRRLAGRGAEAVRPLKSLLADRKAPPAARWHAVWTLDAIDGGQSARRELLAVLNDADLSVRAQAIRQAGGRRVREAGKPLEKLLAHPDAAIRFQAATALGRIAAAASVPPLIEALDEKDAFARYAVFTALNRIGRAEPGAWPAIAKGLEHRKPPVREGALLAFRETHSKAAVRALAAFTAKSSGPVETRQAALALVASLARAPSPWDGSWWSTTPASQPRPRSTNEWAGTPVAGEVMRATLHDESATMRRAAIEGIRVAGDAAAGDGLAALFIREPDLEMRKAILEALRDLKAVPGSEVLVAAILGDSLNHIALAPEALMTAARISGSNMVALILRVANSSPPPAILLKAIEALGVARDNSAIGFLIEQLFHTHETARQAAGDALVMIGGDQAAAALLPLLSGTVPPAVPLTQQTPHLILEARKRAAKLLGQIRSRTAIEPLMHAARHAETREEAMIALAAMPDLRALPFYLEGLHSPVVRLKADSGNAIRGIQAQALPKVEEYLLATNLPPAVASDLQRIFAALPAARRGPIFASRSWSGASNLSREEHARRFPGDPVNGKKIFNRRDGVACVKCHRVAGEGGDAGPDLAGIGAKYNREQLIEQVVFPSRNVLDGYRQTFVALRDETLKSGIVRRDTETELTLVDGDGRLVTIPKSDIAHWRVSPLSLMPDGLHLGLTPPQFTDLIAYLESLKGGAGSPAPAGR